MPQKTSGKKIRVALPRGWYLNTWEMMRFERLKDRFEITAMAACKPLFDLSEIKLDIEYYKWPGELLYVLGDRRGRAVNRILYKYLRYNEWMLGLEKTLAGFDIIHAYDVNNIFSLQAARAKKKYGGKLVVSVAENIPFLDERLPVVGNFSREVIAATDVFLPLTARIKEMLLIEGVPEKKIQVMPHPVDLSKFKPRPKSQPLLDLLGCRPGQPLILYVGRLDKAKGLEFLLYAMKLLVEDTTAGALKPKLVLVGSGRHRGLLERLVHKLGLGLQVTISDEVRHGSLFEYYATADIFVLPSIPVTDWQEQFGFVLIEALASGKPVVSTLSGSIPDVVGDAGLLVQPADSHALYQALKNLALSAELREELAGKARKRAEAKFDPDRIVEETAHLYYSLAGG